MTIRRGALAGPGQSARWRTWACLAGLVFGVAGSLAPAWAAGALQAPRRPASAAAAPAEALDPEGDAVIVVEPRPNGDTILVSFQTARAVTPAVARAIESGLPTTFTYDVELRRPSTFWFDKLMASARIAATVRFDPLTRRYHVTLMQDGRVAEERSTDRADDVRRWVSVFERLPLFATRELQQHTAYDVRVRGRTSPRHTWSFWPWARPSAHGSAGFTFRP